MSVRIKDDTLNDRLYNSLLTTDRKKLVLGRHVVQTIHGWQLGGLAFYEPSSESSQYENTFISGPSGSGKTWVGYSLAAQSYFAEKRTWVIFDTKGSIPGDSQIHVRINGKEQDIAIGELIEYHARRTTGSGMTWIGYEPARDDHAVIPAPPGIETLSVCPDHAIRWMPVTGFSRHVAPESILEIVVESGRKIVATKNHSFMRLIDGRYTAFKGSDLSIGDELPVSNKIYGTKVWNEKIVSIKEINGKGFVYDLQVDGTENFMLANGIVTHNSMLGNWRPNLLMADDLLSHGLYPMGIPGANVRVIAPHYFMNTADLDLIRRYKVTHSYKIPLIMCGLELMFELTKLTKKASYASTFQITFDELLKKTHNKPTIREFEDMIDDLTADPDFPTQLTWVYNMMKDKIHKIGGYIIDEANQWSSLGKSLFDAAQSGVPKWIVFTLVHAKHVQDDMNLALMTAVLTEIREFAAQARLMGLPVNLGVMVDELHTYVNNKDATSTEALHDLIFHWGRSQKIWRIYMTQKQEQLPKTFRDEIAGLKSKGTFQNIIECQAIPQPGYGQFLDRLHSRDENNPVDNNPRYYPAVKFMAPIIEVESDYSDDTDWKQSIAAKISGKKVPKQRKEQKPWETIVAEMLTSNKTIGEAAGVLNEERSNRAARSRTAAHVPEVRNMWDDITENLSGRVKP